MLKYTDSSPFNIYKKKDIDIFLLNLGHNHAFFKTFSRQYYLHNISQSTYQLVIECTNDLLGGFFSTAVFIC